jgi:hypothetical protein
MLMPVHAAIKLLATNPNSAAAGGLNGVEILGQPSPPALGRWRRWRSSAAPPNDRAAPVGHATQTRSLSFEFKTPIFSFTFQENFHVE